MRILFVLHTLEPYGAQRTALGIARHLNAGRWEARLTYWWRGGDLAPAFEEAGCPVTPMNARRVGDAGAFCRLVALLRSFRPDIVHAHVPEMAVAASLARRIISPRTRCLFTMNNPPDMESPAQRRWHYWALRLSDGTAFASSLVRATALRLWGERRGNRSAVVYNGVRPFSSAGTGVVEALHRSLAPAGENILLFLGRLTWQKGVDRLLDAFARLAARRRDVVLALAGEGEMKDELKGKAAALGLAGMVRWLGMRSDVGALLEAADLYVSAARWEAISFAMMEAMACAKPIVAVGIPAHLQLLQNGVSGLVTPEDDPDAFAQAAQRVLGDPRLGRALGEKARERVSRDFSESVMSNSYQDFYETFVG